MNEQKAQAVFQYSSKTKNRRIKITLFAYDPGLKKEPFFTVQTKRLVSFKDRQITEIHNIFTVETMIVLSELMGGFLDEPKVKKAINPYRKFNTWDCAAVSFKQEQ